MVQHCINVMQMVCVYCDTWRKVLIAGLEPALHFARLCNSIITGYMINYKTMGQRYPHIGLMSHVCWLRSVYQIIYGWPLHLSHVTRDDYLWMTSLVNAVCKIRDNCRNARLCWNVTRYSIDNTIAWYLSTLKFWKMQISQLNFTYSPVIILSLYKVTDQYDPTIPKRDGDKLWTDYMEKIRFFFKSTLFDVLNMVYHGAGNVLKYL